MEQERMSQSQEQNKNPTQKYNPTPDNAITRRESAPLAINTNSFSYVQLCVLL